MYLKLNYILTLWIRFNKILIHCTNFTHSFSSSNRSDKHFSILSVLFYFFFFFFSFIQTMSRILYENLINIIFCTYKSTFEITHINIYKVINTVHQLEISFIRIFGPPIEEFIKIDFVFAGYIFICIFLFSVSSLHLFLTFYKIHYPSKIILCLFIMICIESIKFTVIYIT